MIIVNMASSIFLFRFHSILEMSDFQEINIELREAGRYITDINSMVISMSWIYTYIHIYICMYVLYMYMCVQHSHETGNVHWIKILIRLQIHQCKDINE